MSQVKALVPCAPPSSPTKACSGNASRRMSTMASSEARSASVTGSRGPLNSTFVRCPRRRPGRAECYHAMLYLSQIIGKPVYDATGEAFDTIADLVIYHGTEKFPKITGVLLSGDRSRVAIIPWDAVAEFSPAGIRLKVERRYLAPRPLQPDEILLREDIMDCQVVDINDIKVVRVNDVELRQVGNEVRVVGADVGTRALLRRLGLEPLVCAVLGRLGRPLPSRVIPWNLVAVLGGTMTPLRLSISREK